MLGLFSSDRTLLEQRGSLIIRHLCYHLNGVKIYTSLAKILIKEKEVEFIRYASEKVLSKG